MRGYFSPHILYHSKINFQVLVLGTKWSFWLSFYYLLSFWYPTQARFQVTWWHDIENIHATHTDPLRGQVSGPERICNASGFFSLINHFSGEAPHRFQYLTFLSWLGLHLHFLSKLPKWGITTTSGTVVFLEVNCKKIEILFQFRRIPEISKRWLLWNFLRKMYQGFHFLR